MLLRAASYPIDHISRRVHASVSNTLRVSDFTAVGILSKIGHCEIAKRFFSRSNGGKAMEA